MAYKHSQQQVDIFVLTGELSGDKIGFDILKDLCNKNKIEGVLGPNLASLTIKKIFSMDDLSVMGFSKPFTSIFRLISRLRKILKYIKKSNPKVVLLIDLPDINLQIAKRLKKSGYKGKIIQVVCPTIWAWRPKRKKILESYYDQLFCLFPFEKKLFKYILCFPIFYFSDI